MALREILKFPDPRLKQVAEPVEKITDELRELARDMCEAMYDEPGIKHLVENSFGLLCRSNLRLRLNQFIFELHDPLFSLVSLVQLLDLL